MNRGYRLSTKEHKTIAEIARRMVGEGKKRNEILDVLIERFGFASRQTASRSAALAGAVLPAYEPKPNHGRPDARLSKRYKPLQTAVPKEKTNLFAEAAGKVDGGLYDEATGNCYIGRTRVSGLYLMKEANLEHPQ
ncbi:hypothetical protein [Paremcibacter congregatus]|uniref:hypothetical protein n=1 Tax=Paremcibacter congregatus TaxID=2043170 RepID=UPI003A8CFD0D